jgi:hypothetical protein
MYCIHPVKAVELKDQRVEAPTPVYVDQSISISVSCNARWCWVEFLRFM